MSLTKSPTMTPEKRAANQANGRQSHGPATPEGMERTRESQVRHGLYARPPGEALRVLGEDPEEFTRLLESLEAEWEPVGELQSRLVHRLARAVWRMERNDRIQESLAVRRLGGMDQKLEREVTKSCRPYEYRLARLQELAENLTAQDNYVLTVQDLKLFNAVYGAKPEGKGEQILILLTRLLEPPEIADDSAGAEQESGGPPPGTFEDSEDPEEQSIDPPPEDVGEGAKPRMILKKGFLLPNVLLALGDERAEVLERLLALLDEEIEAARIELDQEREAVMEFNLPYLRDSFIAPSLPEHALPSRIEDSSFRQVTRLTDLLLRLQKKRGYGSKKQKSKNQK